MGAAFYAGFLSNLFKRREKSAISQKNELAEKTNILTIQTRELTRTKDYLHEALTKSDKARTELEKTKADLEKSNLELKAKLDEVEKYSEVTTGRELKMMELKEKMKQMENEINELRKKLETR
jgi:peptidoglycan hydrolase CwlO-like protein